MEKETKRNEISIIRDIYDATAKAYWKAGKEYQKITTKYANTKNPSKGLFDKCEQAEAAYIETGRLHREAAKKQKNK